jgi:hypothetical protein
MAMARFVLLAGTSVNPCGKQDRFASEAPPQTVKNHDPGLRFARGGIFYDLPKTCFIVTAQAIEDV